MVDPLIVRLLGAPQFSVASTPIACTSKKSLALFAYLVLTRKAHTRHELAALLWGRRDVEAARSSLRVALHRLPPALAQCLIVDRETIGVAESAPTTVDVARFESLAASDTIDSLESAAALYADELLKDFDATASPEFDDWLHAQRVRLAQLAQRVFDGIIARRAERARHDLAHASVERESALAIGLRWIALMPASEAGHRWLMQLYLDMGRRDAALAQYELCQRSLAVTHGRAPSPETRALQQAALAGREFPKAVSPPAAVDDEPLVPSTLVADGVASTSFVGRIEELAELDALFADPACRLVTLHGLGGSGKTRLAHAFATQVASRFAHGVTWISLEASTAPNALPQAIADALVRELPAKGDGAAAIGDLLARQQRLLILDNFESLLVRDDSRSNAAVDAVLRILAVARDVRIVVTSREVLGVQEEWIYEVRGLPHRDDPGATVAQLPAVELFAQRARQAYLGFSLSAEMPHVIHICRLVEGLPLGIELAAAWVRTIPCADIAAAIETAAAALVSPHRNRPHRHHNLEAVVACSWNLLRDEQREALAGLGVFAGGFTRETAELIADASLRTLSALSDKALVRRRAEGRYDLHEIVRQFALARLRGSRSRHALVSRRHRSHFAELLLKLHAELRSAGEAAADALLRNEFPNILAAWRHAAESGEAEIVGRMAAPLIALLHTRGRLREALVEAERAVALLDKRSRGDELAIVRMQWGRAAIHGSTSDVARRELEAACTLLRKSGRNASIARCLYYLGALEYALGNLDQVERIASEALDLGGECDDAEVRMFVHNLCGTIANMRNDFALAETHLRKGLAAARELGAPSAIGGLLCAIGVPLYYMGRFDESCAANEEAARLYEMLHKNATASLVRSNLAGIELARGNAAAALKHAEIAVRLDRESGDELQLAASLVNLADACFQQADLPRARGALDEGLRLAHNLPLTLSDALRLVAEIDLRAGDFAAALAAIARLRDVLGEHRMEVRVPMLILVAADYAMRAQDETASAFRWLDALARLDAVDASLRDKARAVLARDARSRSSDANAASVPSSAEIESEVLAYLDRVAPRAQAR